MRKFAWLGLLMLSVCLAGCVGTYKSIEAQYPPVSPEHSRLNLEIVNPKGFDKKELESLRKLIISELQKRGIAVVDDTERPKLTVKIVNFNKENKTLKKGGVIVLSIPGPGAIVGAYAAHLSNIVNWNSIDLRVFLEEKGKTTEFKEFQEYQEKFNNWKDMKLFIARRIADAVYYAH